MEKSEISEIKKTLALKKKCSIESVMTAFVDEDKNVVNTTSNSLHSLSEEDAFKYIDLMKKAMSGKIGKNLFTLSFPVKEDDAKEKVFENAYKHNENACSQLIDSIIKNYPYPGKYLIIFGFGIYDVPKKTTDNAALDDSEEVYSFMLGAICPLVLAKDGLTLIKGNEFSSRENTWIVDKPDFGFLYPAFTGRSTDLNSALYYTKRELHEEMVVNLFGVDIGKTSDMEKDAFSTIVKDTLGRDCSYEKVTEITNMMIQRKIDAESNGDSSEISKSELQKVLEHVGATEDGLKQFSRSFDEHAGSSLKVSSLVDKTTKIKSDYVDVSINTDNTCYLESKVINGREYLLIPVADDISVNGIPILSNVK